MQAVKKRRHRTLRFACRAHNTSSIQVSRMTSALFAVRCKRLFGGASDVMRRFRSSPAFTVTSRIGLREAWSMARSVHPKRGTFDRACDSRLISFSAAAERWN